MYSFGSILVCWMQPISVRIIRRLKVASSLACPCEIESHSYFVIGHRFSPVCFDMIVLFFICHMTIEFIVSIRWIWYLLFICRHDYFFLTVTFIMFVWFGVFFCQGFFSVFLYLSLDVAQQCAGRLFVSLWINDEIHSFRNEDFFLRFVRRWYDIYKSAIINV